MNRADRGGATVAVLGCGAWGANHIRVWGEMGRLRVACDPDSGRREAVAQRYSDVAVCADYREALARDDVDGVVIATPAPTHAGLALQAIKAGKHVLVEMPLAINVADGRRVVEAERSADLALLVGHVLEYHPAFLELRHLVAGGELGKILYVYSNRLNFGRVRTEENALWSFAPHDIALLLRLLGGLPNSASARGGAYLTDAVADTTMMQLGFPGGVEAHVFVSWLHPFKEHRLVVVGDQQMAVFDDTALSEEKLVLYPHRLEWIDGRVPTARRAEGRAIPVKEAEPLMEECLHFLECMETGCAPLTDGESGLAVLRVLEAGQRSLTAGGAPVALVEEGMVGQPEIHPSATVDEGATIGSGTKVWHHAHVMSGAEIGSNCVLGQNVFIGRGVRIGDGVKIQNNVSVFEGVELDDEVFCGPSMTFTNVIDPRSAMERKDEFRPTIVKRGASLGAHSTVVCGNTVGRYALVGAGAVVTHDVPDYGLVVGVPARLAGWACECGRRLDVNGDRSACGDCGRAYRLAGGVLAPERDFQ